MIRFVFWFLIKSKFVLFPLSGCLTVWANQIVYVLLNVVIALIAQELSNLLTFSHLLDFHIFQMAKELVNLNYKTNLILDKLILVVKIVQAMVNLFDDACYWELQSVNTADNKVKVVASHLSWLVTLLFSVIISNSDKSITVEP